jgi:hypothetical protein
MWHEMAAIGTYDLLLAAVRLGLVDGQQALDGVALEGDGAIEVVSAGGDAHEGRQRRAHADLEPPLQGRESRGTSKGTPCERRVSGMTTVANLYSEERMAHQVQLSAPSPQGKAQEGTANEGRGGVGHEGRQHVHAIRAAL